MLPLLSLAGPSRMFSRPSCPHILRSATCPAILSGPIVTLSLSGPGFPWAPPVWGFLAGRAPWNPGSASHPSQAYPRPGI